MVQAQATKKKEEVVFAKANIQSSTEAAKLFIKPQMQVNGNEVNVLIGLKDKKSVLILTFKANTRDVEKIVKAMQKEGFAENVWKKTKDMGYKFSKVGLMAAIKGSTENISYNKSGKRVQEITFTNTPIIIAKPPTADYEEIARLAEEVERAEKNTLVKLQKIKSVKELQEIESKIKDGKPLTEDEKKEVNTIARLKIMIELKNRGVYTDRKDERYKEVFRAVREMVKQMNEDDKLKIIRDPAFRKKVTDEIDDEISKSL